MGSPRSGRGARAGINVTPLIDVVLVLLIIFMVLTPTALKHMSLALPRQTEPPRDAIVEPPLLLEYSAHREIVLNGEPVAPEQLGAALARRLRFDRRKLVFVKIEDEASYGEAVRLLDTARGAGAQILAIAPRD